MFVMEIGEVYDFEGAFCWLYNIPGRKSSEVNIYVINSSSPKSFQHQFLITIHNQQKKKLWDVI